MNDEAHHCYQDKPIAAGVGKLSKDERDAAQLSGSTPGFPSSGELQVVAKHQDEHEVRIALVRDGNVVRSWQITSKTWLGPIELAQESEGDVIAVLTQYTDKDAQYRILRLSQNGIVFDSVARSRRFSEASPAAPSASAQA